MAKATKIKQAPPKRRMLLLQSLQTGQGHQGALATSKNPMFAHQPTLPGSVSCFSWLQWEQMNMMESPCLLTTLFTTTSHWAGTRWAD